MCSRRYKYSPRVKWTGNGYRINWSARGCVKEGYRKFLGIPASAQWGGDPDFTNLRVSLPIIESVIKDLL